MSALNCAGHESEIWIHVLVTLCHAHKFYYAVVAWFDKQAEIGELA